MIKTNTPDYASLQNMVKFYAKALCDSILPKAGDKRSVVVDLSDTRTAGNSYRNFKYLGSTMTISFARMFKKYVEVTGLKGDALDEYRLTDTKKFINFFTNPLTLGLISDYIEENYKDCKFKVKLAKSEEPSFSAIIKAHKYFKRNNTNIYWCNDDLAGLEELIKGLDKPEDINNYWMCRNMHGNAPVMIIENASYYNNGAPNWSDTTEANHVRSLYAAYTKTNYMDARPCSYEYWNENVDFRFSTAE